MLGFCPGLSHCQISAPLPAKEGSVRSSLIDLDFRASTNSEGEHLLKGHLPMPGSASPEEAGQARSLHLSSSTLIPVPPPHTG